MSQVAREIESAIQSLMTVSESVAMLQNKLDVANRDLYMLDMLFSVTQYISSNPETHRVLSELEDSVKGVFGASSCQVLFKQAGLFPNVPDSLCMSLNETLIFEEDFNVLLIEDVSKSQLTTFKKGSMLLLKLNVGDELIGYMVVYWERQKELTHSGQIFLEILSTQIAMFLRSAKLLNEFKRLAVLDPLTGIYNRSYFSNIELTTLPSKGESIIMFDIDKFKNINDTKGHQYGDTVLREFANILTEVSTAFEGVTFKFGGEEFVIKLNGGQDRAITVADRVRSTFEERLGYTVSAGISTIGQDCNVFSYDYLLKQADDAMYVSKHCGRNRTTVSTADIQILKASGTALSNLVSKSFRQIVPTSILRFKPTEAYVLNGDKFETLKSVFTSIARIYDEVFITPSLEVLMVIHGKVNQETFINRAMSILANQLPQVGYCVFVLNEIFNEVIVHSSRVSELSQILSSELGYTDKQVNQIRMACEWHDVGKLCTDPVVYSKKGKLDANEYEVIKKHAWYSFSIADQHPQLKEIADWLLYHHEDYNGKGYYGLAGDAIPFPAQIIGIIDKFDALTENRCYRPAFTWSKALDILSEEADKFDAKLFVAFKNLVHRMMQEQEPVVENRSSTVI